MNVNEKSSIEASETMIQKAIGRPLPAGILAHEDAVSLERVLQRASPAMGSFLYHRIRSGDSIKKVNEIAERISREIKKNNRTLLTADDKKTLEYISRNKTESQNIIFDFAGVFLYNSSVIDELRSTSEKLKEFPINLRVAIQFWLFINMFEIIKKWSIIQINEINHKGGNSRNVSINKILITNKVLTEENNSIFGDKYKRIRNAIAHASISFDQITNTISTDRNERITLEKFFEENERLLQFIFEWIYCLNNKNPEIKLDLDKILKHYEKILQRIERSGVSKERFQNKIDEWR